MTIIRNYEVIQMLYYSYLLVNQYITKKILDYPKRSPAGDRGFIPAGIALKDNL